MFAVETTGSGWDDLQTAITFAEEGLFSYARQTLSRKKPSLIVVFIKNIVNTDYGIKHAINAVNRIKADEIHFYLPAAEGISEKHKTVTEKLSEQKIRFSVISYNLDSFRKIILSLSHHTGILYLYTDIDQVFLKRLSDVSFPVVSFTH